MENVSEQKITKAAAAFEVSKQVKQNFYNCGLGVGLLFINGLVFTFNKTVGYGGMLIFVCVFGFLMFKNIQYLRYLNNKYGLRGFSPGSEKKN